MNERWTKSEAVETSCAKRKLMVNWIGADTFKPAIHQKPFRRGPSMAISPRIVCLQARAQAVEP